MTSSIRPLVHIRPEFPLPIHVQVTEQIKMLIGMGKLTPGEMLPPAGQLAEQLQLNRNTIRAIYNHLREAGLVTMQKGRGTTIAGKSQIDAYCRKQQPLYERAQTITADAQLHSLAFDELLLAAFAYRQLFAAPANTDARVLLVECREHDYLFYKREVERITGKDVAVAFLDDRDAVLAAMREAQVIVTTLNHAEDAKQLAAWHDHSVITIAATLDSATLLEIARLDAASTVGFVCLGKRGGEWMAQRVREAGITQIQSVTIGADQASELDQLVQTADQLYASAAVFEQISTLAPNKTRLYPMVLEQSSQALLRDAVHVQSAHA